MSKPVLLLIEGGEVYSPALIGRADVLIAGGKIAKFEVVDR